MANTILEIYEIQNIGKGIINFIFPDNLLLLTQPSIIPGIQSVIDVAQSITNQGPISITSTGRLNAFNSDGLGGYMSIGPNTGIAPLFPTSSFGICNASAFTIVSLDFYENETLFKDTLGTKGIQYAGNYEANFTSRSLVTKQYVDGLVSITPDATSTIKGKLKLTNDLGGTADLPTTPTALHKTGNESFTGIKTGNNSITPTGLSLVANSAVTAILAISNSNSNQAVDINLTGTGSGIYITGASTAKNFYSQHNGSGTSIYSYITSSGSNFVANSSGVATGFNYIGQNNNVTTFSVSRPGDIIANSFIKTGGTITQYLMADGSVTEENPQKVLTYPADFTGTNYTLTNADKNYTIFINNGATAVTITLNSGVTLSNFSVGFIQEGSADITFVPTGVALSNPIGLKSKGQGYQTFIERKLATSNYYLLGNTKV